MMHWVTRMELEVAHCRSGGRLWAGHLGVARGGRSSWVLGL